MTLETLLRAFFTGVCGLTFIIGNYELVTGWLPGSPTERGLGAYRWLTTPTRIRLASIAGLLVFVSFFILFKPFY